MFISIIPPLKVLHQFKIALQTSLIFEFHRKIQQCQQTPGESHQFAAQVKPSPCSHMRETKEEMKPISLTYLLQSALR